MFRDHDRSVELQIQRVCLQEWWPERPQPAARPSKGFAMLPQAISGTGMLARIIHRGCHNLARPGYS